MRWTQLTESIPDISNVAEYIRTNCQPYLQENPDWKLHPLYRGVNERSDIFVKSIRKDRQPKDTDMRISDFVERYLDDNDFIATRTNSIFCTGNYDEAESYGKAYVIFPIGDFKFTWNPTIFDLTNVVDSAGFTLFDLNYDDPRTFRLEYLPTVGLPFLRNTAQDHDLEPLGSEFKLSELKPYFDAGGNNRSLFLHFMDKDAVTFSEKGLKIFSKYQKTDLRKAIISQNEIMIAGSSYLGITKEVFNKIKDEV